MAASLQHTGSRESIVPEPFHSESLGRTSGGTSGDDAALPLQHGRSLA